jgi:hypothetical protein
VARNTFSVAGFRLPTWENASNCQSNPMAPFRVLSIQAQLLPRFEGYHTLLFREDSEVLHSVRHFTGEFTTDPNSGTHRKWYDHVHVNPSQPRLPPNPRRRWSLDKGDISEICESASRAVLGRSSVHESKYHVSCLCIEQPAVPASCNGVYSWYEETPVHSANNIL